jgi:hypothetical protein
LDKKGQTITITATTMMLLQSIRLFSVLFTFKLATLCHSFAVLPRSSCHRCQIEIGTLGMQDDGFTTVSTDKYDIVKVDLDDGRDYPIYIGTGYDDQEGA